jgi:UDP-N-acetylmuramate--L-alanine ligase
MKQHLLFIGIVGHAMRGLALAAKQQGNVVTGIDEGADDGPGTQWLAQQGIEWWRRPDPKHLRGVDLIIVSGGTPADYPLLAEAKERGISVQSFAEYLGRLTADARSLVVAGTHGKTTTTSLLLWLLEAAGRRPDYLVGIRPFNFDSSARLSGTDLVVFEGDEYRASNFDNTSKLQYYHPDVLVLTSVEHDHPDMYPDLAAVMARFGEVVRAVPADGRIVAWAGSETVARIAAQAACAVTSYGETDTGADFVARNIAYLPAGIEFDVERGGEMIGRMAVSLYGRHNVLNALAAVVVALGEGLSFEQLLSGGAKFQGAYRRFNLLSSPEAGVTIIDDYAHHPTEVATTIEAAKLHFGGRRLVVMFRPHTYSRTQALLAEYQTAFKAADVAYVTDIEAARETAAEQTVSGADVVTGLDNAVYEPDRTKLADRIVADTQPGDVVLCMSVSGYDNLAGELVRRLATVESDA